jgi:serine/threonine protein kinase
MDFHPGGDLATQLARWGRLGRDRARFYAAEITEGVTSLHRSGVIYRDLKPENILIAFDGHIVLTDFGLSKQFGRDADGHRISDEEEERTLTFCGTAEYLAPEVLLGESYSYEVDWWSFGTMLSVLFFPILRRASSQTPVLNFFF